MLNLSSIIAPRFALQRCIRTEQHRALARQHTAITVRERDLAILDLALAAFAPHQIGRAHV